MMCKMCGMEQLKIYENNSAIIRVCLRCGYKEIISKINEENKEENND